MAATRPRSLAEQIDAQIDTLLALRSVAADERRTHQRTEELIDGLDASGKALRKLARG